AVLHLNTEGCTTFDLFLVGLAEPRVLPITEPLNRHRRLVEQPRWADVKGRRQRHQDCGRWTRLPILELRDRLLGNGPQEAAREAFQRQSPREPRLPQASAFPGAAVDWRCAQCRFVNHGSHCPGSTKRRSTVGTRSVEPWPERRRH